MKKILTTGLCLALASIGGAEVIQSVNFNPARFGQYERLKVSEQANFKGGLKAKSMQVQSAGTIDLNATPSTGQVNLAYLITKLDGTLGHSHVGDDFPSTPTLVFPATCFSSREHCVETTSVGLLQVAFMNGAARFQAPSSYTTAPESRIKQITTGANRLRLEAVYANIHGKLDVSGNWGYTFRNISPKTPLRLAGNWIPLPSANDAPTGGTLEWQTRKTVKYASNGGDKGGDKVRVLALKGGKHTTPPAKPGDCKKGDIKKCGDSPCKATRTCLDGGFWDSCERGTMYPGHDAYCTTSGRAMYCGAACMWSDTKNRCVRPSTEDTADCPDNDTAKRMAREMFPGFKDYES